MVEFDLEEKQHDLKEDEDQIDQILDETKIFKGDNNEFIERFDSRGQKMRIRRGEIFQP